MDPFIDPTSTKKIHEHTEYDVGFYCLFSKDDMKQAFKHHCFGRYSDQEFAGTLKFGIQLREESVSLGAVMKIAAQRLEDERNGKTELTLEGLGEVKDKQKQEVVNDEDLYPRLFMELSHQVYLHSQRYRKHP
jgi:hypothetical protein